MIGTSCIDTNTNTEVLKEVYFSHILQEILEKFIKRYRKEKVKIPRPDVKFIQT